MRRCRKCEQRLRQRYSPAITWLLMMTPRPRTRRAGQASRARLQRRARSRRRLPPAVHDAARAEIRDLALVVADFAQYFVRVLTERRRRAGIARGVGRDLHR